jgi:hypothetical protein
MCVSDRSGFAARTVLQHTWTGGMLQEWSVLKLGEGSS